jgi:hypothetical protein
MEPVDFSEMSVNFYHTSRRHSQNTVFLIITAGNFWCGLYKIWKERSGRFAQCCVFAPNKFRDCRCSSSIRGVYRRRQESLEGKKFFSKPINNYQVDQEQTTISSGILRRVHWFRRNFLHPRSEKSVPWYLCNNLQRIISQKGEIFIITDVRNSDVAYFLEVPYL